MSVTDNIGLRSFDEAPFAQLGWRRPGKLRQRARALIDRFGVKTRSETAAIDTLSGGNVQRAVLARELSHDSALLLVSNPTFGLDFSAVGEVHRRLIAARDGGAAVLMVSEDLDELLQVADRIVVMSEGRIVHSEPGGRRGPRGDRAPSGRRSAWESRVAMSLRSLAIEARPFPGSRCEPGQVALMLIDLQRDFVEPGGFGAALGNDVTLLQASSGPRECC